MAISMRHMLALLSAASLLATGPAYADDDAAKTGIAAGIGLTAASGKTTLGDGAGAIEASLLDSDAMLQAGAAIRQLALRARATRRPILILSKADAVDFSMALWVMKRMAELRAYADATAANAPCKKTPIIVERTQSGRSIGAFKSEESAGSSTTKFGFAPTDIAAALATDVSVGAISLSAEDRTLINAIQMGGATDLAWRPLSAIPASLSPAANQDFRVLNETAAVDPASNAVFAALQGLQSWTDRNRKCDSDEYKAAIDIIDKFVAGVTTSDKGNPAIVTAAELTPDGFDNLPLILRVAIDDRGGTSITRSNIWFSIGLPGAAVVTSGLKVSFQFSDPKTGMNLLTGLIRCATRPTNYRDVRNMLVTVETTGPGSIGDRQEKLVTCSYRLS